MNRRSHDSWVVSRVWSFLQRNNCREREGGRVKFFLPEENKHGRKHVFGTFIYPVLKSYNSMNIMSRVAKFEEYNINNNVNNVGKVVFFSRESENVLQYSIIIIIIII